MKACIPLLFAVTVTLFAFQGFPRCTSVEPDTGKAGDTVSAKGESLGKKSIAELYLTPTSDNEGGKETKATILEQTDTEIKFKVPQIKAGRYRLLVLTANKASMIDQPVVFTVE